MKQKMIILMICILLLSSWAGVILDEGIAGSQQNSKVIIKSQSRGTIIVDINGNGDYTNIQDAINNSKDGDTIYVWAGTYYENIVIDKKLTINGNSSVNTIINGSASEDVVVINADKVNINGFMIINSFNRILNGIRIDGADNCHIFNNNCSGITIGQWTSSSTGSKLTIIENNTVNFINLYYSDYSTIKNNTCFSTRYNIQLLHSNFNTLLNNSCISTNKDAVSIHISFSDCNKIIDNNCTGMVIFNSLSNQIENNRLFYKGLIIRENYKGMVKYWSSHQIKNNTVDSKLIYYIKNTSNICISSEVGQIFLINCNKITIENQFFNNFGYNINLINSTNILIRNNTQTENYWNSPGIFLYLSDSNIIANNNCSIRLLYSDFNIIENNIIKNKCNAIWLGAIEQDYIDGSKFLFISSNNNNIMNNTLENNFRGILIMASNINIVVNNICNNNNYAFYLDCGRSNLIHNNTFSSNDIGAYVNDYWEEPDMRAIVSSRNNLESEFNKIYYNNLLFNSNQVEFQESSKNPEVGNDPYSVTIFNNSEIGNYWSDYNGTDNDSDGVGDTNLPWHGVDYYPLMKQLDLPYKSPNKKEEPIDIKLELNLDKNQIFSKNNITGELIFINKNTFDYYTYPDIYYTIFPYPPNLLFEIYDQDSTKIYYSWDTQFLKIPAKSNKAINFSLSVFNTTKEWTNDQFKLPPGNYSIQLSLKLYTDFNYSFDISSDIEYFQILGNKSVQKNNVTISLNLVKQEFMIDESITGAINITNNNLVDIELENITFQRLLGYNFEIRSVDDLSDYGGISLNYSYPLTIKARNSAIFEFELDKIIQLPVTSKELNYTKLNAGRYSIHAFFYYGNLSNYNILTSNTINFQIVNNIKRSDMEENIFIHLELDKLEFNISESITGSVNISNNNSFEIILNDDEFLELFGVFFGFYSLDYDNYSSIFDRHFEANIEHLEKYYIKAKSTIEIKFKIEKYVRVDFQVQTRSNPEGNWTYYYLSNLPLGKYYIAAYIYELYRPDYELDAIDEYKILSKIVNFSIIEKVPEEIANISVKLQLSKFVYHINESINGTINITNNNPFQVELEKNMLLQRLSGEHFLINSNDNSDTYGAFINNIKYPINISAQNYIIINFSFNLVFKYPMQSKNITFTTMSPGNYSIFAYFYYGNLIEFVEINSNIVTFKIIENNSSSTNGPGPGTSDTEKEQSLFSRSFGFISIASVIVVIILISTAFVSGTEIGKYGFFGGIVPLYTKTRKKKLDKNYGYKKGLVMGCILSNPGESYNSIKRTLDLNNGALAYYLKILEHEGTIKSERDGMYKRFYPTKVKIEKEKFELSQLQKDIYEMIKKNLGITQKDISSKLGIAHQTVNYHIQIMRDARIIKLDRDGKKSKCFILEEIT